MKPSIFKYATNELSQDALLCYLLEFSKKENREYEKEYLFANLFLNEILKKFSLEIKVEELCIKKQYYNIDILLIINDEYYIIIEDKTFTQERKGQMTSYKDKIKKYFKNIDEEKIYGLYFKTGDESFENIKNKENTENMNIKSMLRKEIINIFENYSGDNIIFNDYLYHLKEMQLSRESFANVNLKEEMYTWDQIIGLYNALDLEFIKLKKEKILPDEIGFNWEYVSNKNGGFMSYYFSNVLNFEKYGYYMQIEASGKSGEEKRTNNYFEKKLKLSVKVWSNNKNIDILYKGFEILKKEEIFSDDIRPSRFSKGTWMTQMVITDYIVLNENGTINISQTALNIIKYLKAILEMKDKLKDLEI